MSGGLSRIICLRIVTLAKFNYKNIAQNKYFCAELSIFAEISLFIKNEELRTNNKPKNKRRRIYD